ncbi:hypothetical protein AVEN_23859-1 [Araneus ventricosus]|uniref:Uncharacterized protein n=1 Tax=Araneus ventricosus TaxID=182803 RepID=A0A4Y2TC72_ARAVE|nr:hypothetical protein AVEN_23859-1 [Araneus ventricosus]
MGLLKIGQAHPLLTSLLMVLLGLVPLVIVGVGNLLSELCCRLLVIFVNIHFNDSKLTFLLMCSQCEDSCSRAFNQDRVYCAERERCGFP